jgi:hypothetical protein
MIAELCSTSVSMRSFQSLPNSRASDSACSGRSDYGPRRALSGTKTDVAQLGGTTSLKSISCFHAGENGPTWPHGLNGGGHACRGHGKGPPTDQPYCTMICSISKRRVTRKTGPELSRTSIVSVPTTHTEPGNVLGEVRHCLRGRELHLVEGVDVHTEKYQIW